jgi:Nucleotidyl transferase AbiEii toxin, Type IV TA system
MLVPRLDALPRPQRWLWPKLVQIPEHFVLYGGTAVALRLGHRQSADFDFFSDEAIDPDDLYSRVPFLSGSPVIQKEPNTLGVIVGGDDPKRPVKVSLFGKITFGCVAPPDRTSDDVIYVASAIDLLGTKLAVLLKRLEAKDYRDIAALLRSGVSLGNGLAAAGALYGPAFAAAECLKALVYFEGGDVAALEAEYKKLLIEKVRQFKGVVPAVRKFSRLRLAPALGKNGH